MEKDLEHKMRKKLLNKKNDQIQNTKNMKKSERKIAMEQARSRGDTQGSAIVIIPGYQLNTTTHCYDEIKETVPSPKLYERVGYNDLAVI